MIGKSQNRFRSLIFHFSGAVVIFFLAALFFISNTYGQNIFSEEIVFISKPGFLSDSKIQTTIFKPSGLGPFPLVIINHGKNLGNPHQQERFRPMAMVQYFIERDYVVVVPMRHGFAQSDGESNFSGNSVELYGLNGIGDLKATIDYAHTLPYVNKNITVMVGQSTGGWVTLAYGTSNPDPSVKGLVNFSGVVKEPCCFGLYNELIDVSGNFGDKTSLPTIWFYGDNDSLIDRHTANLMFVHYSHGNPNSRFIPFGLFSNDAHNLLMDPAGRKIWEPFLTQYLYDIGVPYKPSKKVI